jgi:hypothetical protein
MDTPMTESAARNILLSTAQRLKQEYGIFIVDPSAKQELQSAVSALENTSWPPDPQTSREQLLGDWTLICTTSTSGSSGVDTSLFPNPLQQIRKSITDATNKFVTVQQRIRAMNTIDTIDRIDHVLEYQPPAQLSDLLGASVPSPLAALNINPLEVSKSSLCLIHKAEIASERPLITRLALSSIVLNVAGQSTLLNPNGADVAGINLPLGEFINTGDFTTTYMDDTLRISRGKQGFVDQLRVFVREEDPARRNREYTQQVRDRERELGVDFGTGVSAKVDVDDGVDPEFKPQNGPPPSDIADEEV